MPKFSFVIPCYRSENTITTVVEEIKSEMAAKRPGDSYEIVLVNEIQPVNYTVEDNRIRVVLEDFTINRLLERVWLSRTTHYDLLQEAVESGALLHRLILENYRDWYQHPEIILDNIVKDDEGIDGRATLHNVLLASELTEVDRRYINSKNDFNSLYGMVYPWFNPVGGGNADRPVYDREKTNMNILSLYEFLLWSLQPDYSFASADYAYFDAPAFITQINREEPVIYAEIISDLPDLNGKEVYQANEVIDNRYAPGPEPEEEDYEDWDQFWGEYNDWVLKSDEYDELYSNLYDTTFDVYFSPTNLNELWPEVESIKEVKKYEWDYYRERDPKQKSERERVVVVYESSFSNSEELKSYLDTMHVKALVRSDIALCSDRGFTVESESYPMWYGFSRSTYAYDGTEAYSFEMLKEDLAEIMSEDYSLEEREEPLKTVLSIPVLTYYRGYLYPVEEYVKEIELRNKQGEEHEILEGPTENVWLYEFNWYQVHRKLLDRLFERPVPKKIAEERKETLHRSAEEKRTMLAQVREELSLPTPEAEGVTRIPGLVIPEGPTEEATETPTEAPSETDSETGTVSAMATTEQEPKTSSEALEGITEASESAAELSPTEATESEIQTEVGASGGKWILPTAIAAIVVALTATTVTVAVRKKKH